MVATPASKIWSKDGKILISATGSIYDCAECPCEPTEPAMCDPCSYLNASGETVDTANGAINVTYTGISDGSCNYHQDCGYPDYWEVCKTQCDEMNTSWPLTFQAYHWTPWGYNCSWVGNHDICMRSPGEYEWHTSTVFISPGYVVSDRAWYLNLELKGRWYSFWWQKLVADPYAHQPGNNRTDPGCLGPDFKFDWCEDVDCTPEMKPDCSYLTDCASFGPDDLYCVSDYHWGELGCMELGAPTSVAQGGWAENVPVSTNSCWGGPDCECGVGAGYSTTYHTAGMVPHYTLDNISSLPGSSITATVTGF